MEDRRSAYRVLVVKPEGKKPVERTKHRWQNNIQMDI
jgi:hypothetical protein